MYRLLTSIVTSILLLFGMLLSLNMCFKKSVESFTYESMLFINGLRSKSLYSDSLTVGPLQPDIIGLPGTSGL